MQVKRSYSLAETLYWSRTAIALLLAHGGVAVVLYELLELRWLSLPWLPMSLIGIAVAFTLGFKNNSAYGRLWEARQIWGAIVNASRSWGIMVKDFVDDRHAREPVPAAELAAVRRE